MSLEGIQKYVQTGPDSYFEQHLPACRCVSCRDDPRALPPLDREEPADPDPFVCWIAAKTDQTFGEWMHSPRPPETGDAMGQVVHEYHGLMALLGGFFGDVAHLGWRGLWAIVDAAGWMLGLVWSTACACAFPFRVGRRFFYGTPGTLGQAIDATRTCAFCGHNVGATVTGCPDHGGINPRPTAVISGLQSADAAVAMARVMRETSISAEDMQRGLIAAAQAGPSDSGGELTH